MKLLWNIIIILFLSGLILSCNKNDKITLPDFYMTSKINNQDWEANPHKVWCSTTEEENGIFSITIECETSDTINDGGRYQFTFSVRNPNLLGKHFYNNTGSLFNEGNGAIGIIHGWLNNYTEDFFRSYSINGYFEITEHTDEYTKGMFEFDAPLVINNDTISVINIREGKFCANEY